MDTVMTQRQNDFLQQLLETMQRNSDRQEQRLDELTTKIDGNTATTNQILTQAQATNGQVLRHDQEIKDLQKKAGSKLSSVSPNVIYLVALGSVILLMVIATMLHVDIKGLFK